MITEKMKEWLESLPEDPIKDVKFCVYMNRIRRRIQREFENFRWLCERFPEIFLDEEVEINDLSGRIVSHRRFKALLECVIKLNPEMDIELVLKRLEEKKPRGFVPVNIEEEIKRIRAEQEL